MRQISGGGQRVLITGGSGFIGRNLVEYLHDKYEVLAPARADLDLQDGEAVDAWLARNPVDAVVHCATTPGHRNAPEARDVAYKNLRMSANLTRVPNRFTRFILLGSGSEYDQRHYQPKMHEQRFGNYVPADENALSKYWCSSLAQHREGYVVLRPFGVFGKYEDYAIRFISNAICKVVLERPITIKQNRRIDYVYIDDLSFVVDHFLTRDARYRSYNVTPDQPVELLELARLVGEVSGRHPEIKVALPGMGIEYSGDNSRLKAEMPGLRLTPLRNAIGELFQWYRRNRQSIRPELLDVDK